MKPGFFWIRKQWSYGPERWIVAERDENGVFWLKGSAVADEKMEVGPEIIEPGEDDKERGFDHAETYYQSDNPFWDATDAAHPAWWRGDDHGVTMVCERLKAVLDGEDIGHGIFGHEPLELLRRRLLAIVTLSD